MILNFKIENFGSIKQEQEICFEVKNNQIADSHIVELGKYKVLKLGLIFGANASGKTTIIRALDFLRILVLKPAMQKNYALDFEPFLFDSQTPNTPSKLSLDFVQNEIKYSYVIEFNKRMILKEKLDFYDPNKANIYTRTTIPENEYSQIDFGKKITADKVTQQTLTANTLANNTLLGGYLKTNIKIKQLQETIDWFNNYLKPAIVPEADLTSFAIKNLMGKSRLKNTMLRILQKADFNISDIKLNNHQSTDKRYILNFILENIDKPENLKNNIEIQKNILNPIHLEHEVENSKYTLPWYLESKGTQRYFGMAGVLSMLIGDSCIFPIDELESSLHPDLYIHFLQLFLTNSDSSQVLATTHNRDFLTEKEFYRYDEIYFTEKNSQCATQISTLSSFDSTQVRKDSSIYNIYKNGRLGAVPATGDDYI